MYLILFILILVLAAILYVLYGSWSVTISGSYDRIFGGYDSDWIEYYEATRNAVCDRGEFYVINPNVKLAVENSDNSGVLAEITALNEIMVSRAGMVSGTFKKLPSLWTEQYKTNLNKFVVPLKKNGIPDKARLQFLYDLIMSNRGLDPLNKKYDNTSTKDVINQHVIAIRQCIDRMRQEIQQIEDARKREEDRRKKEEDERRKKEEEERKRVEEEERRKKEEEERKQVEEDRRKKEEEDRRKKEEEDRRKKEEDERRKKVEDERRKKEEEDRRKKEEEDRRKKVEDERRKKVEDERRKKEDERKQVEEEVIEEPDYTMDLADASGVSPNGSQADVLNRVESKMNLGKHGTEPRTYNSIGTKPNNTKVEKVQKYYHSDFGKSGTLS